MSASTTILTDPSTTTTTTTTLTSTAPALPRPLFIYGTLLEPSRLRSLLGHVPPGERALLPSYRRHPVRGCWFPAIVKDARLEEEGGDDKGGAGGIGAGGTGGGGGRQGGVKGVLLYAHGDRDRARLERYEGGLYAPAEVKVLVRGAEKDAVAYVWKGGEDDLEMDRDWEEAARFLENW